MKSGLVNYTSQEVMMDEYGVMVEQLLAGKNQRNLGKNLLQCQFVHHKYCMKSPGIQPETPC
jgi:hypothetical protein